MALLKPGTLSFADVNAWAKEKLFKTGALPVQHAYGQHPPFGLDYCPPKASLIAREREVVIDQTLN